MKLKSTKRKIKKHVITVKVDSEELESIKDKAEIYTSGNMSDWIRYASVELVPRGKDLEDEHENDQNYL